MDRLADMVMSQPRGSETALLEWEPTLKMFPPLNALPFMQNENKAKNKAKLHLRGIKKSCNHYGYRISSGKSKHFRYFLQTSTLGRILEQDLMFFANAFNNFLDGVCIYRFRIQCDIERARAILSQIKF